MNGFLWAAISILAEMFMFIGICFLQEIFKELKRFNDREEKEETK